VNELALFAGAGGGILASILLGDRIVCAVEYAAYPRSILLSRQNDGTLPPFPIWDDIRTFDGKSWRGIAEIVSGGFPCQDISVAGGGKGWTEKGRGSGQKWLGLFVKYSRESYVWKTAQCSLLGGSEEFLETWPRWGSMRNGESYLQPTAALPICESASGLWPTPTVSGNYNRIGASAKSGTGLATAVKMYPTPVATQYKGWSKNHNRADSNDRIDYTIEREAYEMDMPGRLNPTWVEWLMGWPLGWTDLKPLATDRFREWLQQHGGF
jgi:hypothetical protein